MHEIERVPALTGIVGVNTPRHAEHSGEVHREEREVHRDEVQPEVNLAQLLAHQPAGHLREVVVDTTENSHA